MIRMLETIRHDELERFGGKGCNLAFLHQHDFNVPAGFVVSSEVMDMNIGRLMARIREFTGLIGADEFSVRSSMVLEDGDTRSFAGVFSSFMHVRPDEILPKVIECQKSVEKEHVQQYCRFHGILQHHLRMAVVVQRMVDAKKSGVTFTMNPVNGNEEMVVESAYGQGEYIVSGKVTPERYIVRREPGNSMLHSIPRGGECLTGSELRKIIETCLEIENRYRAPQDIEWTIGKDDRLWILQSRPITSLL